MAKTGCECGVGLWNGYGPGGVNWDILPMNQFKVLAYANPTSSLSEVRDLVSEKYYNYEFHNLWSCRRCKRIQIWKIDGLYVAYEPKYFDGLLSLGDIFKIEEWIAINDYDLEENYTAVYNL